MQVIQAAVGAFHHFDLARELEARGYLKRIYSGFPWRRLRREEVSRNLVTTLPWFHTPLFLAMRHLPKFRALTSSLAYRDIVLFDSWVAARLEGCDAFVALSGCGLRAGQLAQRRGSIYVCDRGSSHIRYQDEIVTDEYRRWDIERKACDDRTIAREEAEYAAANAITVPSEFARRSFVEMGVPAAKVVKISYGVLLSRFRPTLPPPTQRFEVLFAGSVSLRKGFPYLIQAFQMLRHPHKRLRLVGAVEEDSKQVLARLDLTNVEVLGSLPQEKLAECMSGSHAMVLPSLEEGLALVQAQAMACGCPLISSLHTGAEDLIEDGVEGFLVPIRSPEAIHERFAQLAGDAGLQQRMSAAALSRVRSLGGWSDYGEKYSSFLKGLTAN